MITGIVHYDPASGAIAQVATGIVMFTLPGCDGAAFGNVRFEDVALDTTRYRVDLSTVALDPDLGVNACELVLVN